MTFGSESYHRIASKADCATPTRATNANRKQQAGGSNAVAALTRSGKSEAESRKTSICEEKSG